MEEEVKKLRKELESSKKALKVQTARCRHLVAAFTKRLAEKDSELKQCRKTREEQLSGLLRALLVLESRLKREQKYIKELLAERDNLINFQRQELEKLRVETAAAKQAAAAAATVRETEVIKPQLDEEITIVEEKLPEKLQEVDVQPMMKEVYAKPDLISSLGLAGKDDGTCGPDSLSSDTASNKSCMGDDSDFTMVTPIPPSPQVKGVLNVHNRSAFSPIKKLIPSTSYSQTIPDVSKTNQNEESISGQVKPSALLQQVRIGNRPDEYRDNPVLQCVNQILLKDQEDFLEEQRSLRMKDPAWLDEEDSPVDEEEVMLEESRTNPIIKDEEKLDVQPKEKPVMIKPALSQRHNNPPLPPKPKGSGKRVGFVDVKPQPTKIQFHNPPLVLPPPQDPVKSQLALSLSMLGPEDQGQDSELYVISNSALDDDIVKQLRGRTLNVPGLHIKSQRKSTDHRSQHSHVLPTCLLHPSHKKTHNQEQQSTSVTATGSSTAQISPKIHPHRPPATLKINIQESPKKSSFVFKSPPKVGMPDMIKVASPVATLLTTVQQESTSSKDLSENVSNIVRRFEDIKLNKPEETTSVSASSTNLDKVVAVKSETTPKTNEPAATPATDTSVSYDNFLEATGLSQKSIMTPSRLVTNHRSVVKPKDVKLRSKVKAAGVIERCIPPQVVGPTIKYWTEPFL